MLPPPDPSSVVTLPLSNYESAEQGYLLNAVKLDNPVITDNILQSTIERVVRCPKLRKHLMTDLTTLGDKVTGDGKLVSMQDQMERIKPTLQQFGAYGHRIDKIHVSQAWKDMKAFSAETGLISDGYEWQSPANPTTVPMSAESDNDISIDPTKAVKMARIVNPRIKQYLKLLIWMYADGLFSCPIAMTDGAAKLLSDMIVHSSEDEFCAQIKSAEHRSVLKQALHNLLSNIKDNFWTSGQWMTERGGGSDVSNDGTKTVAKLQSDGYYRLYGYKWFSSATDADMAIALARVESDETGEVISGNSGIACFYVPMRLEDGSLNGIRVVQLKDKLGTRPVPTAELELIGARAIRLSDVGRGVPAIMTLANVTRIHNATFSLRYMKQSFERARMYAQNRRIMGGKLLENSILHRETLAMMSVLYSVNLQFWMKCVELLGVSEIPDQLIDQNYKLKQSKENAQLLLRLFTPILKLSTAKIGTEMVAECMESMGGIGYLETSGVPISLRNAHVLHVWEGTTNILALDVWRVIKHPRHGSQTWTVFCDLLNEGIQKWMDDIKIVSGDKSVNQALKKLKESLNIIQCFVNEYAHINRICDYFARDFSMSLARLICAFFMFEHYYGSLSADIVCLEELKAALIKYINGDFQGSFIGSQSSLISDNIQSFMNNPDLRIECIQQSKLLALGSSRILSSKL